MDVHLESFYLTDSVWILVQLVRILMVQHVHLAIQHARLALLGEAQAVRDAVHPQYCLRASVCQVVALLDSLITTEFVLNVIHRAQLVPALAPPVHHVAQPTSTKAHAFQLALQQHSKTETFVPHAIQLVLHAQALQQTNV